MSSKKNLRDELALGEVEYIVAKFYSEPGHGYQIGEKTVYEFGDSYVASTCSNCRRTGFIDRQCEWAAQAADAKIVCERCDSSDTPTHD